MKLKDKNAVITGGSLGLGRTIAEHYLQEGANVLICARNPDELKATQLALKAKFPTQMVLAKTCDVSDETQVKNLIEYGVHEFGMLHVLVLNAGIYGPMGPTEEVDIVEWRKALDVNLFGVLLPCRAVIPFFKTQKSGKIIILSGGGATNPLPNISAYAASKAAAIRLMETIAEELKPFNIDVNAIAPGALATRLVNEVLAAGPEKVGQAFFEKNQNWKTSGGTPLEMGAELAIYLASKQSNGITGKLISAQWDNWKLLHEHLSELKTSDIYCLRRIIPADRNKEWN